MLRVQLLVAVLHPGLDDVASAGLAVGERELLLELFSRPARDAGELLLRASISRMASTGDDNLVAMMAASLESDCMRLGVVQDPWAGRDPVWR